MAPRTGHPLGRFYVAAVKTQGQARVPNWLLDGLEMMQKGTNGENILLTRIQPEADPAVSVPTSSVPAGALMLVANDPASGHCVLSPAEIQMPSLCVIPSSWTIRQFYGWQRQSGPHFPSRLVPIHIPLGDDKGYIDVVTMKVHTATGDVLEAATFEYLCAAEPARMLLLQELSRDFKFRQQADWDVPPPALKQLVREAAETGLLTPIFCVNAQKQLDSLLSTVSDYVPSMLEMKQGTAAGYHIETGRHMLQWKTLRRSLNTTPAGECVASAPYQLDRHVGLLEYRRDIKGCGWQTILDSMEKVEVSSADSTAATQQYSMQLDKCNLYVHDMTPQNKGNLQLVGSALADGMIALFDLAGSSPNIPGCVFTSPHSKHINHPTGYKLESAVKHAKALQIPMLFALDITGDDSNLELFRRLALRSSSSIGYEDCQPDIDNHAVRKYPIPVWVQLPMGIGACFQGFIDLVDMTAHTLKGANDSCCMDVSSDIPSNYKAAAQVSRRQLIKELCAFSDKACDAIMKKRDMDAEELRCLIRMLTLSQNLVPLICFHEKVTSNQQLLEQMVLKPTVDYLPSPADFKTVQALCRAGGSESLTDHLQQLLQATPNTGIGSIIE